MTNRYTNEEWAKIIADVEKNIKVDETKKYAIPEIGSEEFTRTVDHTLLKLDAKENQFDELCAEARENKFATVCVRPNWVQRCVSNLKGSDIRIASVIGFHEGTYDLSHKLSETKTSLDAGATELDLVLNYPNLQQSTPAYTEIYNELRTLRTSAPHPILLKLILETSQLSQSQIIAACVLASAAELDYVKTATGFNGHGATVGHVRLMKTCCEYLATQKGGGGRQMKVKASGGIRSLEDAVKMLGVGASRLGTSGGVGIAKEARERVHGQKGDGHGDAERSGTTRRLEMDY